MDAVGVPLVHGGMESGGMADGDEVEGHKVVRDVQYPADGVNAFLVRGARVKMDRASGSVRPITADPG